MRHKLNRDFIAAPLLATLTLFAAPALAQDAEADNERCRANPDADTNQGRLARKLDDCDGILKPPKVGDTEMVEPAPDTGTTPLIRPEDLPRQQ
ncbi:hypothetical protein [Sinorhizobium americanum]|uniref:Secreted protein n=1 Tax=Sinorhizobium americanum TaxID=194963 RepID=A0A4R2B636_9HYPH|nr:hypothetical protein [Sinorhizobium americanum]TCN21282.1 hypothetical protein EV184_12658 [Sinorhizobium americanum]